MQLDVKTLYLLNIAVAFVAGGVSFFSWLFHRDMPGLRGWAIGVMLAALGSLVLSLGGTQYRFLFAIVGNTVIVAGYVTIWMSVRLFNDAAFQLGQFALAVGLFAVPFIVACLLDADVRMRVAWVAATLAILSLLAAWEAFHGGAQEPRGSRTPTAAAFGLIALTMIVRAGFFMLGNQPASGTPFHDPTEGVILFVNTICVVAVTLGLLMTANERLRRRYEELASTDELTSLPNRRFFLEHGHRLSRHSTLENSPTCILMMDLDHFSEINRNFGHSGGDQALVAFDRFARRHLRPSDLMARYGGEEFCAVLSNTEEGDGRQIAERLRTGIAAMRIGVAGRPLTFTVSIGVALLEGGDLQASIRNADIALYRAKALGRNLVCSASDDPTVGSAQ